MRKKIPTFVFLYFFLLVISSKAYSNDNNVLRIGVALGFSGPIEKIVSEMYDVLEIVRLEAQQTDYFKKKIEFVKIDTKCDKSNFKVINNKVNEKKLVGIIGAACPGITEIIVLDQAKNKIPIISPAASSNELTSIDENNFFFRTTPPNRRDAEVLADITKDKGIKSVAITFLNNDYGGS